MSVIKVKRTKNFTTIANDVLQDPEISFKAKGVVAYLFSKPDGWDCRIDDLVANGKEGVTAIRSAFKELESKGYAKLVGVRNKDGSFAGKTWEVTDMQVFPTSGKSDARKTYTYKKKDTPYKGKTGKPEINAEALSDDLNFSIQKEKELGEFFKTNPAQVEAIKDYARWQFTQEQFEDAIKEYVLHSSNLAQLHKDPQLQMKAIYRWFQRQKRFTKSSQLKKEKTFVNTPRNLNDIELSGKMKQGYEKYLAQVKDRSPQLYNSNCRILTASEFESIFSMKKFPTYIYKGLLTLKEKMWEVHDLFNNKNFYRNTNQSITPMLEDYLAEKIKLNGDLQRRSA